MAVYDLKAYMHKIYNFTGSYGIKFMSYGQGLNQYLYAITKEPRFFNNIINQIVALAPCVYQEPLSGGIEEYRSSLGLFQDFGVYAINDPYWQVNEATLCQAESLGDEACELAKSYTDKGSAASVKQV